MSRLWAAVLSIFEVVWLKKQPLAAKMFIFSTILVVVPMSIVGLISYHRSAMLLEQDAREHSWQMNEQVKTHIEYYLHDFEIEAQKVLSHPDMLAFLHMRTPEEVEQSNIRQAIQDIVHNTAYSRVDISSVSVIVDGLQVVDSIGYRSPYPADRLQYEYWYSSVPNYGSLMVSRFVQWPDRREPVISIIRRINSPYTLEPVGLLIIDVNFRRMQEIADKVNQNGDSLFFILDAEGHYVYHPEPEMLGRRTTLVDTDWLLSQPSGSIITSKGNLLSYNYAPALGWRFVTSLPYAELMTGVSHIAQTIIITVVVTMTIAYILGASFAAAIIRPIRRLRFYMKQVEQGNFNGKVAVESEDEIGQLTQGFNRMVEKLSLLMEEVYLTRIRETEATLRQKEMELKVLQSQMNPHFLCNSLEGIRGMALEEGNIHIAAMSASLGQLLQYNLRDSSPEASLREEMKFCQVYLQIQKFRFEERLAYSVRIPDWAKEQQVVKFILQPLVENSICYGRWAEDRPLSITVSAYIASPQVYILEVEDNGAGIEQERLEKIREDLRTKDIMDGGDNIGLVNVQRRVAGRYGAEFGLEISSTVGQGTTVRLRMPLGCVPEEEQDEHHFNC